MVEFDTDRNQFKICIPVSNLKDIHRYHQSIISVLDRIEIDECDPVLKEDLNAVYELLSQLLPDKNFLDQHSELLNQLG